MTIKRVAMELGMGTSLRQQDYTSAAMRAVQNALWRNSLNVADALGFAKDDMLIDVEIAAQKPDEVDLEKVKSVFPYGQISAKALTGGLDIPKPDDGNSVTILVQAAILVSFDVSGTRFDGQMGASS